MNCAHAIKRLRQSLFMNQTDFASRLGVSFGSVCNWEMGRRNPRIEKVKIMLEMAKKNKIKVAIEDFLDMPQ